MSNKKHTHLVMLMCSRLQAVIDSKGFESKYLKNHYIYIFSVCQIIFEPLKMLTYLKE